MIGWISGAEDEEWAQRIDSQRMTARQLQPVFIVGQHKCGTTWLLRILSAHPNVIGVTEFDVVTASCDLKSGLAVLAPTAERLSRFFDKSMWCNAHTRSGWDYTDVAARFERGEVIPIQPWKRSQPRKFMHLSAEAGRALYEKIAAATTPPVETTRAVSEIFAAFVRGQIQSADAGDSRSERLPTRCQRRLATLHYSATAQGAVEDVVISRMKPIGC